MNSPAPTLERLERLLGLRRPPAPSRIRRLFYWVAIAGYVVALGGDVVVLESADSLSLTFFRVMQLVLLTTIFGFVAGNGLYAGAFGRSAGRFGLAGRTLRMVFGVLLVVALPVYCVAAGGYFGSFGGHPWASGAVIGACAGLGWELLCVLWTYYYRRRANR